MKTVAICGALVAALVVPARAQHTIWQIGRPDDSSREFHDSFGVNYASATSDVVYVVGKSTARDWPRFQPGPANGLAGGRLHPFRIEFALQGRPRGTYALKLAMLYETPRLSALRVEVNGHAGVFTFQPKLDYGAGDWEGTFVPQTSRAERTIEIPSTWLHTGDNTMTLTAVDDPATPVNSLGDIAPGVSGLVYDALTFEQFPEKPYAAGSITAAAQATIFFRTKNGKLSEDVHACVEAHAGGVLPKEIALRAGGYTGVEPLHFGSAEFGESCADFDVPEWTGTQRAALDVNGKTFPVELEAQKKWTILVVPHEHLDIGFTDYREKVAELQSQSIDGVLDLLPEYPQFRWTMDGSWVAEQFLAGRSPERTQQFLDAIRAGKIVLPPQYANQHTGVASLEGLTRSLYYSHDLAKRYGLPVGAANITDVPSYSWSYASILHDAGIRYLAAGSNSWRAPVLLEGRWNEKSPFYWEGPDGGRVLMWYSRAYLQLASMFGTPPTTAAVKDALPVFLQAYARKSYVADSVILFGSQLENTALDRGQVTLPAEWAEQYAYPRLEFSTFKDAMSSIEQQFGGDIPTYRGDFGPYWEDGFTSDAWATAKHRANQQRFLNAETIGTIPSLLNPALRPDASLMRDAWRNSLLFDEHTWTAAGATAQPESDQTVRQWAAKRAQVVRAGNDLTASIDRSFAQLEAGIKPKDTSLIVFNSLNWPRGGWLETDLPEGRQIVDPATGAAVPEQVLRVEKGTPLPGFGGRLLRVRYRVDDVPAVGYKLLSVVDGRTKLATAQVEKQGDVLENRFYRVTLDAASGSIRSIRDKQLNRDLVDAGSPYRFGSYLYVTGADTMPDNSLYRYGAGLPLPDLTPHSASNGRIVAIEHGADTESATMTSSAPNTPSIITVVTLPNDAKRIEISIALKKIATLHREAAYIAFPFAVERPKFAYDTQNGWVDPAKDELEGGSREWYAVQHWATVRSDGVAAGVIPIDAPMVAFGDIVRGAWPKEFKPRSATIFSWLMSNYWSTNFKSSQGGEDTFRYVVMDAAKFDPAQWTRSGWERMTPLESDAVPASPSPDGIHSASFLSINNANVVMSAWKRAEDGNGSIVRLTEIAGLAETVHLRTPHLVVEKAWRCSLLEECGEELPVVDGGVVMKLKPFEIVTLRLLTQPEKTQ